MAKNRRIALSQTLPVPQEILYELIFNLILDFLHEMVNNNKDAEVWDAISQLLHVSGVFRHLTLRACTYVFNTCIGTPEK